MMINTKKSVKKRPESPLSALASMDFSAFDKPQQNEQKIIFINPNKIKNWSFHDRPENELGDIDSLAKEFKNPAIGQQQPCIVRQIKDGKFDYEVIAGERRWRAAKLADVKLAVLVKQFDDSQAAYCQIAENHNRKDLSEYSVGMSFATLIKHNFLKQKDLQDKFNLTPVQINRYLAFSQLPSEIKKAIGNMSKMSARTAAEIRSLCKKGDKYKQAIIQLAKKIASGNFGEKTLKREIEKILCNPGKDKKISARKFADKNGKLIFSATVINETINIKLSNDIAKTINKESLLENMRTKICELL